MDIRMCLGGGREAMPVRATAQGDYSEETPQNWTQHTVKLESTDSGVRASVHTPALSLVTLEMLINMFVQQCPYLLNEDEL